MPDQTLLRFARQTEAFQRMAATELRLLAQQTPEAAHHLTELAEKLEEHADEAKAVKNTSGGA
jgi:hypothetical protein